MRRGDIHAAGRLRRVAGDVAGGHVQRGFRFQVYAAADACAVAGNGAAVYIQHGAIGNDDAASVTSALSAGDRSVSGQSQRGSVGNRDHLTVIRRLRQVAVQSKSVQIQGNGLVLRYDESVVPGKGRDVPVKRDRRAV